MASRLYYFGVQNCSLHADASPTYCSGRDGRPSSGYSSGRKGRNRVCTRSGKCPFNIEQIEEPCLAKALIYRFLVSHQPPAPIPNLSSDAIICIAHAC